MSYLDQFHYQIYGNNNHPKLVFLHGLMGFGANWRKIVSSLEDSFHILTFDQRGHGRSMKPPTGYAPEDYAHDLLEILNVLGWQKINLVGHSMGGRNAISFASQFPHRVISLVIEDIGPTSDPNDVSRYQNLLGKVPTPFSSKKEAKEFLLNDFGDPVMGNYFYSNLVENDEGLVDWRFSKEGILESVRMGRKEDRWKEVQYLAMPTLLIRGENSTELSQETYEKMLQINKKIEGVVIAQSGHWVHFDQPEKFTQKLKEFLLSHQE
jgi:pimeloyl-ACP methyl ester carboxylesterase